MLLLVLLAVGFASHRFIQREVSETNAAQQIMPPPAPEHCHNHETEIELSFSSPPKSIRLQILREGETEPRELTRLDGDDITNPSYLDLMLPCGEPSTYWLDISWPEAPHENALHICKLGITSSDEPPSGHTFTSSEADMNETFTFPTAK